MAISFNFEIEKKPTSKGVHPVYIRITSDRKHKRIKTSIALNKLSDWNSKAKSADKHIRQSEPHFSRWNQILSDELESVKESYRSNKDLSLDALSDVIKKKDKSDSFLVFAKSKVEQAGASEAIGTYRHYRTTLQKLDEYLLSEGRSDILFSEIDLTFLKGFESYLGRCENKRTYGRTLDKITIANYLKKFRKLVYEAVDEGKIPVEKNPFLKFKIKQGGDTKKEKLEKAELEKIISLELEEGSAEWHTRNAFLFSFYCAGIRAGDLLQLRWGNVEGGRLNYKMGKTDKIRNYELVEDAESILSKYRTDGVEKSDYIFPFLNSKALWAVESYKNYETMADDLKKNLFNQVSAKNVILNRNLKKIAEKAHIDKNLSMHISRHTFANLAMKDNLPASVIKMLLAHSSIKTTEGYMGSFSNDEADRALEKMFSRKENASGLFSSLNNDEKEILARAMEIINQLNK